MTYRDRFSCIWIAALLGTSPGIATPSKTILFCSSDRYTLGFNLFSISINSTTSGVIIVRGWTTLGVGRTKWRLVLVSSEICRCDKSMWFKSRTLSRNNDANLLPLTYKPPRLFTSRLTTGSITSSLSYTSSNFIQALLKCEGSAADYSNSPLFTNHFQKTFEGLFFRRKNIQSLHQALWRYIYLRLHSCTAFVS